ncbi:DNA polymerase IV (DinB-like DNA polymerase) [Haladaptatus litoreus]|uniref:DNA polymerase IV n=1 Tax=Haladaptatus litoreus TaxID=553468 RepID=A0A1N6XP20_9EURY|nr:DNA polymerase IV [Haladaptatus litoreus]SIR04116.1 DNA polymerase IV (DinB-like DNA polymerase) [Haladaptatus litoreus]
MSNRGGSRLPGVGDEREERIVFHVDMDCFYAACERLREPELEGEPVVVGMGYEAGESHGAVATASYEAREHGVESAQAIGKALERLPRKGVVEAAGDDSAATGYYRPVDIDFYKSVSEDVRAILHDCADTVREVSIDEAYLDVTDRTAWKVAEGFARHVKNRIQREVGVPASVGVAPNMSTAKIASDYDKPDGLVVVEPGTVRDFLAPLGVAEIHGVGPVTARELREMGIETAGDLADADPRALADRFGERGRELHQRARGDDDREVTPRGRPKSLSRESAFTGATSDSEEKRTRVETLATAVAERARDRNAMYRTIGVKVVTPPFDVHTRERSLPGPVDDPELVVSVALDLLSEFADDRVRKVGVRVSNLQFTEIDQTSLDGFDAPESVESEGNREKSPDGGREPTESEDKESNAETEEPRTENSRSGQVSLSDF